MRHWAVAVVSVLVVVGSVAPLDALIERGQ